MADRYLVDTNVFLRLYIEQVGFERALAFPKAHLDGLVELETVDVVRLELGHALRKTGLTKNKMTPDEYVTAVQSIDVMDIPVHMTGPEIIEQAAHLAGHRMIGFFDAVLVAWALELDLPLLTADDRLIRAAAGVGARFEPLLAPA